MSKEGVSLAKWPKLGVGHEGGDGPTAVALTLSFELWEKGARVFFAGPMSSSPFPVLIHSCVSDRSQHIRLQIDEIGEGALGELRRYRRGTVGEVCFYRDPVLPCLRDSAAYGWKRAWGGAVRAVTRFDGDVWPRLEICNWALILSWIQRRNKAVSYFWHNILSKELICCW